MDSSSFVDKFSVQDLIGYLFPGVITLFGMYLILETLNIDLFNNSESGILLGIVFFVSSYVIGILISGLSHPFVDLYYIILNKVKPEDELPAIVSKRQVEKAVFDIFGINIEDKTWSSEYFYLCRSIVYEKMPLTSSTIHRQSALRLVRQYIIIPILIWLVFFILQTNQFISHSGLFLGIVLIELILTILLLSNLINRLDKNRRREVYNVIFAILAIHKSLNIAKNE